MRLEGHGISVALPGDWEGAILRPAPVDPASMRFHSLGADSGEGAQPVSLPVVHLANFPLPAARGDFGSGAVEQMDARDVFVALVEYGAESVGTPLFDHEGIPSDLRLDDFHPFALQRALPGQAGYQGFFTAQGRAFCLYVVLGGLHDPSASLRAVNAVLAGLEIAPAPDQGSR